MFSLNEKISSHFTWGEVVSSETAKKYAISNTPSPDIYYNVLLASAGMEKLREILGNNPIKVNSWYRSKALNDMVGGSPFSDHMKGFAVDFICPKYGSPYDICKAVENSDLDFDTIIHEYGRWVHISFNPKFRKRVLTKMTGTPYLAGILPI